MSRKIESLPLLLDLPVIRATYCNQDLTDTLLLKIWTQKPEWIKELLELEAEPELKLKGQPSIYEFRTMVYYQNIIDNLTEFLRRSCLEDKQLTRLGLLDLLYELTRRLRKSLGLPQLPLLGKELAPSPEGPFPALENVPLWPNRKNITQKCADQTLQQAYERRPDIFYELAEQMRRSIETYEIQGEVREFMRSIVSSEDRDLQSMITQELVGEMYHRLFVMCGMKLNLPSKEMQ